MQLALTDQSLASSVPHPSVGWHPPPPQQPFGHVKQAAYGRRVKWGNVT